MSQTRPSRPVITAIGWFAVMLLSMATTGCDAVPPGAPSLTEPGSSLGETKIGVLLVSHGSHSEKWRNTLLDVEDAVRDSVLAGGDIAGIKSAFMEYTEPSIATRLKEFDQAGFTHVMIVPILLAVSSHSFDDIPVIAGQKADQRTSETLRLQGIDVYRPRARVTIAPLLDFPNVLANNVIRRVVAQSDDPETEGVVLVAYGDKLYDEEWKQLLEDVGNQLKERTRIDACTYC